MSDPRDTPETAAGLAAIRAALTPFYPGAPSAELDQLAQEAAQGDIFGAFCQGRPHLMAGLLKEALDSPRGQVLARRWPRAPDADADLPAAERMNRWRASGGRS